MAGDALPLSCPACGSRDVERIPLLLIAARYYKCGVCAVTFRRGSPATDAADIERFNTGFPPPGGRV